MMVSLNIYTSLRLTAHQVRLVDLLPGRRNEEIECSLWTDYLLSPVVGPYEALSYEWGESNELMREIKIEGKPFLVRQNLWLALQCLRSLTEKQTFWIDAICINQSDTTERNHQVELMGQIYRTASRVRVWLGDESKQARAAFSFLRRAWDSADRISEIIRITTDSSLYHDGRDLPEGLRQVRQVRLGLSVLDSVRVQLRKRFGKQNNDSTRRDHTNQSDELLELLANLGRGDPFFHNESAWEGLAWLMERSYWTRIWIVQEYISAKELTLHCGLDSIDGVIFDGILAQFSQCNPAQHDGLHPYILDSLLRVGSSPGMKISNYRAERRYPTLMELLETCKICKSSEPRDRIYALIGLAADVPEGSILVDYNRSMFKIKMDVAWFFYSKPSFRPSTVSHMCCLLEETLGYSMEDD